MKLAIIMTLFLSISACSGTGVKVWERDLLSEPAMQLEEDLKEIAIDEHLYFSKEGTSGGRGYGGGGCGCN